MQICVGIHLEFDCFLVETLLWLISNYSSFLQNKTLGAKNKSRVNYLGALLFASAEKILQIKTMYLKLVFPASKTFRITLCRELLPMWGRRDAKKWLELNIDQVGKLSRHSDFRAIIISKLEGRIRLFLFGHTYMFGLR